jgi:hypothetical protein
MGEEGDTDTDFGACKSYYLHEGVLKQEADYKCRIMLARPRYCTDSRYV